MTTHDPRQVVEDLRNHLATHDRHLSFLFGAGTSCAVNIAQKPKEGEKPKFKPLIPGIDGLTALCSNHIDEMGKEYSEAWNILLSQCDDDNKTANIENLLTKIRMKIDAIGKDDILVGLNRSKLINLDVNICARIAVTVQPNIPAIIPHNQFALWAKKVNRIKPIEIFTTNYDILFETSLEKERIPVFDGFVGTNSPFFYPECLDDDQLLPNSNWIRLWKLHGSVNWAANQGRIIRSIPNEIGELIFPSYQKYDQSRKQPYISYMDRLSRLLNSDHSLLITCGYSFGDEHLNAILYSALENQNTANIYALQFDDLVENSELVNIAKRFSNLTVIGKNKAVISGEYGSWKLTQPIDNKTHTFMDIAFDSNALVDDQESEKLTYSDLEGNMRLGDFYWFCRFLYSLGVNNK